MWTRFFPLRLLACGHHCFSHLLPCGSTGYQGNGISGHVSLTAQYVHPLLTVVEKLSTNFNVVELTMDSFMSRFNRPLDIASARKVLSDLIEDIIYEQRQQGKKFEDIRIIVK